MLAYKARLDKLRSLAETRSSCGLVVSTQSNVFYFTGFKGMGVLVVAKDNAVLIVPALEYLRARKILDEVGVDTEILVYQPYELSYELIVDEPNPKIVAGSLVKAVMEAINDTECLLLHDALSRGLEELSKYYKLESISTTIRSLRMIKDDWEIERIRIAVRIAENALSQAISILENGVTEAEVAGTIEYFIRVLGGEDHAFPPIVAFGENTVYPHAIPSSRRLRNGEPVLVDLGVLYNGYNSDMTRTLWYGEASNSEFKTVAEAVLEAFEEALEEAKPGIKAKDLDSKAREVLAKYGLSKYFNHSLGHGVGIDVHEAPRISPDSETPLETGMVFTIEPGVYIPGKFGVRIEDTVVVTTKGAKPINRFEYRLWL